MNDFNLKYTSTDDILEAFDLFDILIAAIARDPKAIVKIMTILSDKSFTAIQKIPYVQMQKYLVGVKKVEDGLGAACKLSERLFSDPRKRGDNALRVYKMVTATDTEKKIGYLVDSTRALLLDSIDVEMLFRIYRAIVESMPEDLFYLSNLVEKEGPFKGNIRIHALSRVGLMISAGVDGEADVEEQEYMVSSLGFAVDRYALSFNNVERQNWYNNRGDQKERKFDAPTVASNEEVQKVIGGMFADNNKSYK